MGKNTLWKEIENATWSTRIDILCNRLNIPLLTSRGDLRKVHRDFQEIYQKLNKCYNDNMARVLVQGTVVAIYARMCVDSSLRNKLVSEKSFYTKIIRLLDYPLCRAVTLQCLVTLIFYGNHEFSYHIASYIPKILKIAQQNTDDPSVINACATIICRSITMVLCPGKERRADRQVLESVGPLQPVFTLGISLLNNSHITHDTYKHILYCLLNAATSPPKSQLSDQPPITIAVAALRSATLELRVYALKRLMLLHADVSEEDNPYLNAETIISNIQEIKQGRKFSNEAMRALQEYGMSRSDITLIDECFTGYVDAMVEFTYDHDYYSLGMKLFELIGRTEFSISDRYFNVFGDTTPISMGMPFTHWLNALPRCAEAIREKSRPLTPSRDHIANVLDLKVFLLRHQHKEARELATKALEAHPKAVFYYYVLTIVSNGPEEQLRWARKGLKIQGSKVEPFVRHGMLFISTHNAVTLGFEILDRRQKCEKEVEEAYALLKLALEDIKAFIAEAPPDNRFMTRSIQWCILLTTALKGPELSLDLREIQPLLNRLAIAEEIESAITKKPAQDQEYQYLSASRDVVKNYTSATKEWGHIISRFDAQAGKTITNSESDPSRSPEDELADWLNGTSMGHVDGHSCGQHWHRPVHSNRPVFGNEILLYVCANCGNSSVALKKCTRCLSAKYCDASCQKSHWQEHKKICKSPEKA